MFEKFFKAEIEEIRQNKVRVIGLVLCLIFALGLVVWNYFGTGEEIIVEENPIDKKNDSVKKVSAQNVIEVIGANSDILFVQNPFRAEKILEEEKIEPPKVEEKISEPVEEVEIIPQIEEQFILVGTAITSEEKTALIQHKKNSVSENIFVTVGEELGGKKILDITEDYILLDGGEKVYLNLQ